MENTVFIITHLTMAICCLVIIITGIRVNKKEKNQAKIIKQQFIDLYNADIKNDLDNESSVITKTDLRLITS